jgi:hypothetical protein
MYGSVSIQPAGGNKSRAIAVAIENSRLLPDSQRVVKNLGLKVVKIPTDPEKPAPISII